MIEKYISKLIEEHNEAILPGFGAFMAGFSASEISGKTIVPPHLKITFYPKLTSDKNYWLKKTVLLNESISESDFDEFYYAFIQQIEESIAEKGQYKFLKFGTLKRKHSGEWEFEQDNDANLYSEAYGLPPLQKSPLKVSHTISTSKEENLNHTSDAEPATEPISQTTHNQVEEALAERKSNSAVWLLLIPIIAVGAYLFYLFTATPEKIVLTEEVRTETPADKNKTENTSIVDAPKQESEKVETSTNEPSKDATHKENLEKPKKEVLPEKNLGNFCLIVGSVKTEEQAKEFVNKLKKEGYNSAEYMLNDANGQYRVAAGIFSSADEANKIRKKADAKYKGAWVFKK